MSEGNGVDGQSQYPHPQQISGLLNHSENSSTQPPSSYPDPLQSQTAPQPYSSPQPLVQQPVNHDGQQVPFIHGEAKNPTIRLRKACDSCSLRKVKCDESGPPCRSCAALDIPCTFERPTKRRGPPNRHAEAIKKQRLDQSLSQTTGRPFEPDTSSVAPRLSVESICPFATLQLLIDDYFTYIHPLIPLPHEPTFRMQFQNRDDLTDKSFLSLVANMVAILVASFPRRSRQLLNTEDMRRRFPNAGVLVNTCLRVSEEARGTGFLSGHLTWYDALSSYLSGLSYAYMFDFKRARLFFGESVLLIRVLNLHRSNQPTASPATFDSVYVHSANGAADDSVDYVHEEMCRRLFWVSFVSSRHIRQIGSADSDLLFPPLSSNDPPPPLPLEIDDVYISKTHITEQPPGFVSELCGFNANINATTTWDDLVAMEAAMGLEEFSDLAKQKRIIAQCLRNVKRATASLPPELLLDPDNVDGWPSLENRFSHSRRDELLSWGGDTSSSEPPYTRRRIQFEIQKANIYSTQLATRSYLVEKYWGLVELQEQMRSQKAVELKHDPALEATEPRQTSSDELDPDRQEMANERDEILRDLSVLLSSVNQVNMEPNGGSFSSKIRSIAGPILGRLQPSETAPSSLDYESLHQYLAGFIDILLKLEHQSPGVVDSSSPASGDGGNWLLANSGLTAEEIEERELVQWASLKEHQERFARESGFLRSL